MRGLLLCNHAKKREPFGSRSAHNPQGELHVADDRVTKL